MRFSNRYWFLALACGVASGALHLAYLRGAYARVPVAVATRDIQPFTLVERDMVRTELVHPSSVHPTAIRSAGHVVGKYTGAWCYQGQQILKRQLSDAADGAGPLPPEPPYRAMLVPASVGYAAGGAIRRGDTVDLLFVSDPGKTGVSISKVVEEGLLVLDIRDDSGESVGQGGGSSVPLGVLVAVTSEQAERIAFCLEHGRVYLLLSTPGNEPSTTNGACMSDITVPR